MGLATFMDNGKFSGITWKLRVRVKVRVRARIRVKVNGL